MDKRVLLVAGAVVLAVALPVALADLFAGPSDGKRVAPVLDPADRQVGVAPPDPFFEITYLNCRSSANSDRFASNVLAKADGDMDKAVEAANLWASMLPDFPPDSDCHWECIVHGLNRTSCDPVYAPIALPCGPGTEGHACQSFACEPVWDGARAHCGYYGNVTGHTYVITDGTWAHGGP